MVSNHPVSFWRVSLSAIFMFSIAGCCLMDATESYRVIERTERSVSMATDAPALLPDVVYGDVRIAFAHFAFSQSPWSRQVLENGVRLLIRGVRAISREEALTYGSLSVPGGDVRSLILRTGDGGRSWREVLIPEALSTTSEVFFNDGRIGWAVVLRTPGGIESATMYQTHDRGVSWRLVGPLPNFGQGSFQTVGLRFVDINHGEVWAESVEYIDGAPDLDHYCLCRTTDGGMTWVWTTMCCDAASMNFDWVSPTISTASDGSQWKCEHADSAFASEWHVCRRGPYQSKWQTAAVIPQRYVLDDRLLKAAAIPPGVNED